MRSRCCFWVCLNRLAPLPSVDVAAFQAPRPDRCSAIAASILLLTEPTGAGESGKSTILKQMKLIHEGGYSRDERESFKEIIFSNTVQSMRVILEAMESLELPLEDQRMEYHVQTIFMQPAQIEGDVLPPEVGNAIEALWKDRGVQECFKRSREYQLNDSAR